ncbi:UDP-2,3-diacylglucosamine diphosphatase [Saccharicrinis sp. FJH54]|uniref:UDP-2,3-diacylglucosamine diphosphatase n=1 Tax=Saccharicrinis sp. FJH54 TaxID=3344665 RepID=UPI0035D4238B
MTFTKNPMHIPRDIEIAVISDIHLGTHACKARELISYLKSIKPAKLILNGDIIDSWRFSRSYFPKTHLKIIRLLIKFLENGTEVIYITGNHDEVMRNLSGVSFQNLKIVNQLELNLNGIKTWIFHGDFYDRIIHRYKWLARTGAALYGLMTVTNKAINKLLSPFGKGPVIIYKTIKEKIKTHPDKLSAFEEKIITNARRKGYGTVICGHTHTPVSKTIQDKNGTLRYLNCGDWVEHCTSAEYTNGIWTLKTFTSADLSPTYDEPVVLNKKSLYYLMVKEFPRFSN